MDNTMQKRIAILVADGFQEVEFERPRQALVGAGARADIVSDKPGRVQAFSGAEPTQTYPVAETIGNARPEDYDALFVPGGLHSPAILAADPRVLDFIRRMDAAGKPVTSICRGGYVLAAAGVVKGRRATGAHTNTVGDEWWYLSVKERVTQAGGVWEEDSPVVVDANLLTSRYPGDIPQFNAALLKLCGLAA